MGKWTGKEAVGKGKREIGQRLRLRVQDWERTRSDVGEQRGKMGGQTEGGEGKV